MLAASCFEDPIEDELSVEMRVDGSARIEFIRQLHHGRGKGRRFDARMIAAERATLDGSEPLVAAFDDLARTPSIRADGGSWERSEARLKGFSRWLETADPEPALREALSRGPVSVSYSAGRQHASLQIVPLAEGRASRAERQAFDRLFEPWAERYADYLDVVATLWAHLDLQEQRAEAVMTALFADLLDDPSVEDERLELTERETELIQRHEQAMDDLLEAFAVDTEPSGATRDPRETHSLQELSRLVFDPLPAALRFQLPSTPSSVEGFEIEPDGTLRAPRPGLWQAWSVLSEEWISPNPVVLHIQALREEIEFDLADVLATKRRAPVASVTGVEVRRTFATAMRGPELLALAWPVPSTREAP